MALLRILRRRLSLALVLSLLFAQWATASYACPRGVPVGDAAAMAAMPDCAGMAVAAMDPEQPQLCKAHCEHGLQSVNATPQPEPTTLFSVVAVIDWRAVAALPAPGWLPAHAVDMSASPPPGSPPLYLLLRVLRD